METSNFTRTTCLESTRKYKTVKDWIKHDKPAYLSAVKNNWISDCVTDIHTRNHFHMDRPSVMDEALSFNTVDEFREEKPDVYFYAERYGWIEEITAAMKNAPTEP